MRQKLALLIASLFLVFGAAWAQAPVDSPEQAITGLLNRIGGNGAADLFEIVIDASLAENGKDVFVITSQNGKPCIKGNTQLSVATGINWYLNHYAHINLTWNNLTTDLSQVTLPVPGSEEKHVCNTTYRYNFNTCTFSYSMAFWTWERWQQEIDWMALHGINAPLNLVGLDVVTRKFLRELGVSENDINAYIAGPGFIAWFAMNNLEGWGGTINSSSTGVYMNGNPDWWYKRQEQLCRNMLQRMRELGMQPVIPGFSGQVPNCIVNYTIPGFSSGDVINNGTWAGGYTRPDILKPFTDSYKKLASVYYKHLEDVMGVSEFYSMDPFHEGTSLPSGITADNTWPKIMAELDNYYENVSEENLTKYSAPEKPKWIIQKWQSLPPGEVFSTMSGYPEYKERFIGLDLFADNIYAGNAAFWQGQFYAGCPYVYCMLHNFGGRSGMHGRLETTMDGYFQALAKGNNCQGIGATPEGIETNPILYDMLFELPWMDPAKRPTADEWLAQYNQARYGTANEQTLKALKLLKKSVWDCKVNQQGTSEAVILARPNWTINSVSTWSTSNIYWDTQDILEAADLLVAAEKLITSADGIANYNYDVIDVIRQAMVDYAAELLPLINAAKNDDAEYTRLYQLYLQLMLDLDAMLSYDENFKLERWTSLARNIADEVADTDENDRNWLEWNARTQITVWSKGNTDLHDYSNRCWSGLIKDFHYKRWEKFFTTKGGSFDGGWYSGFEYPWTIDFNNTYNLAGDYSKVVIPTDMTATEKAVETFGKYFGRVKGATKNYIFPMGVARKATKSDVIPEVCRGQMVDLPLEIGKNVTISSVWVDLNNDGAKGNGETLTATNNQVAIPADAKIGKTTAQVVYSDGTDITFNLALIEDISAERTVTAVAGANGSVAIEGTNELSITNTEAVKMTATANTGYNFENWTKGGEVVSNDNPFIYYGKESATFTANFIQDKWGIVECGEDVDGKGTVKDEAQVMADISTNNQYVPNLTFSYYNREVETIFEAPTAPTSIFTTIPQIINVPRGASFTVAYGNRDNFKHCYFRAYIDLNADGDFDDEGELLKEVGSKGAQNTAVCSNSINVLLPYDMPLGITHMRLRFDSAWNIGENAKSPCVRPVYELIINVTDGSAKAAHVVVESNNDAWGTAEVWTDETPGWTASNEWDVSASIPVHIKATKASEDVEFLGWYDQYNRLLTTELQYSMLAREDATYTAKFRKVLEIDGWEFEYRTEPGVVILTSVRQSGDHDLDIPETVEILGEQCKIVGFDNGVFNNNKDLWSIRMPKSMEFVSSNVVFETSLNGNIAPSTGGDGLDSSKSQLIDLGGYVLDKNKVWTLNVSFKTEGKNSLYNQWGTILLSGGNNASNNQWFYLSAKGNGYLRLPGFGTLYNDQYDNQNFFYEHTNGKIATFTVSIANQGNGTAIVTVINSEGVSKSSTAVAFDAKGFTQLSSYITKGVNITKLEITEGPIPNPFSGCSHLGTIAFSETCDNYYVDSNGDLYNSSKVLICSPEGKTLAQDIRNLGTLIDNTQALMDVIATSVDPIGKATEITLSATEGNDYYILCNNPHVGGNDGAGGVAALLDEDASTYLHTNWDANTKSKSHDYLQINNVNPEDLYNFKIAGQQRSGASDDYPKNIEISGSKNGTDWTYITTVTGLPNTSGATWSSGVLTSNSKYTYYKFVVKTHNNYNGTAPLDRPYFHMAKFDLFKLTSVVEVAEEYKELVGITNDEAANVYDNLVNALFVYNNGGTDAELQAAYNALEPLYTALNDKKNKLEYVREINELVPATEELINAIATSVSPVTEIALSTTEGANNNYIWCNAPTANEGVGNLLDNQDGTILHTAWNAGAVSAYQHYLLIELADGEDLSNFKFRYKARTGTSNTMNMGDIPSGIKVYGSMEQDGVYDELYTISGLTQSSGYDWTSPAITGSPSYRYLRFNVTANSGYWHMAEFDLFKVASDIEVAPGYKNFGGIKNEDAEAAYDNMVKAQALCTTGTATELEAALNALRTSYETLNAKKGKVLNGVYNINFDGGKVFVGYSDAINNLTGASAGYKLFDSKVENTNTAATSGSTAGTTTDALKELHNNAIAGKVAADELFTIVPNSAGTGYTISAQGQYLHSTTSGWWGVQHLSDDAHLAGVFLVEATSTEGIYKLKSDRNDFQYINDWGPVFGNDKSTKDTGLSIFSFTPVTEYTLAVPASGYTTLCLPFNVVLPEGVEAYDITTLEKQVLVSGEGLLQKLAVAGEIVRAGTPMIIKATQGDHTFTITMDGEGAKTSLQGSVLCGNFVKQNLAVSSDVKKYVLNEDVWTLLEIGCEIPANTCWIEATELDYDYNIDMTPEFVEFGGWKFRYEPATNGIMLTDAAVSGNGELVIPATVSVGGENKNVVAISPDFLHGNTKLTSITIPATMVNLGFRKVEPMFGDDTTVYEGAEGDGGVYEGNKEISQVGAHTEYVFPIDPVTGAPFKVASSFAWRLTLDVTIDDPKLNFNNYGSAIVSTNKNSLADSYVGDMQIYMKEGHKDIMVKIDNADDRYRYTLPELDQNGNETGNLVAHDHFIFELEHDGSGGYQVVIYYDDGRAKMYNISASEGAKVNDFDRLYYSLPKGIRVKVKVEKLISEGLFVGCTSLHEIIVDENNPTFKSCEHGVLYDKNGYYVMRIPEGETSHHFEIPSKVVKLYAGAVHGVSADIVLHSNPQIGVVEGHEHDVENALFYLSLDDIDNTITENETGYGGARDFISANKNTYKAARYKRKPLVAGKFGTICLPFVPENALAKYDFFKFKSGNSNSLAFTQVDQLEANEAYIYRLKENPADLADLAGDEVFGTDNSGNDIFETNTPFAVVTKAKYDPTSHQPGTCEALGAFVNFYVTTSDYTNSNFYLYKSDTNKFHRVTNKLTYRPYRAFFVVTPDDQVAQAPSRLNLELLDGTVTSIDASLVEGMEAPEYYDLSGRRVLNPVSGGIYIVNGQKVVLK